MVLLIKQLPIFIRKYKTKGQKLIQSFIKGSTRNSPYFINKEHPLCKNDIAFCDDRTSNGQKECLITNLPANKFPPETLKNFLLYTLENRNIFSFDQVFCQSSEFHSKNRVFATGDMGQDDLL